MDEDFHVLLLISSRDKSTIDNGSDNVSTFKLQDNSVAILCPSQNVKAGVMLALFMTRNLRHKHTGFFSEEWFTTLGVPIDTRHSTNIAIISYKTWPENLFKFKFIENIGIFWRCVLSHSLPHKYHKITFNYSIGTHI